MSTVASALKRVRGLLERAQGALPAERFTCLILARQALADPVLQPFIQDPLCPFEGRFLSLDAELAAVEQALQRGHEAPDLVGSCWGALYLPAQERAAPCRVWATTLATPESDWAWPEPLALQTTSEDIQESAQRALEAALAVIADSSLPFTWPPPAQLLFWIEGERRAVGHSLTLPLALVFLSTLTGLPIPTTVGATGALRQGRVEPVGWLSAKEVALAARGILQRVGQPGESLATVAVAALVGGEVLAGRGAPPAPALPPGVVPTFLAADVDLDPLYWERQPRVVREVLQRLARGAERVIAQEGGVLYRRHWGSDEGIRAAFANPESACRAAAALQRLFRWQHWSAALPALAFRMGIHRGVAEQVDDGYVGPAVRLAACLMRVASPGQVLVTAAVAQAQCRAGDPPVALGLFRLSALSIVIPLWSLNGGELPRAPRIRSEEIPLTERAELVALAEAMGLVQQKEPV